MSSMSSALKFCQRMGLAVEVVGAADCGWARSLATDMLRTSFGGRRTTGFEQCKVIARSVAPVDVQEAGNASDHDRRSEVDPWYPVVVEPIT